MHPRNTIRGFTLIELLVTMALFTFVITIATGALYSAQAINTRLQQTQTILDGVNLATEVVVRDIRFGASFYCDTSIPMPIPSIRKGCPYPTGGSVLIFRPILPLVGTNDRRFDRVAYYLSEGMLYKDEFPFGGAVRTYQITSSDVNVERLSFYAAGVNTTTGLMDYVSASDYSQPVITMILSGVTVPKKASSRPVEFSVQTSAVSRALDN